ncbi:MAG: ABC transporter permease [Methylobacteriaceae bacterium]|nr:ABC transporter permease [Methylobacteriaceae bacterium]
MQAARTPDALTVQARVIGALILREINTRFGEFRAGYLWAVVEPAVHVLSFAFLIAFFAHVAPLGTSLEVFVATAVIPFFFWRDILTRVEQAQRANRALLYFPIVKVMDAVFARVILEIATWLIIACFALALLGLSGFDALPADPLGCIGVMLVIGWSGAGFGMINLAIGVFTGAWERVLHVIIRPIYLFSGVAFLPSAMPDGLRDVIWFLPTAHLIDWLRECFFDGYHSSFLSKEYVVIMGVVCWAAGLFLERLLRARNEME